LGDEGGEFLYLFFSNQRRLQSFKRTWRRYLQKPKVGTNVWVSLKTGWRLTLAAIEATNITETRDRTASFQRTIVGFDWDGKLPLTDAMAELHYPC
jgi:hypothetical protein